MRRLLVAIIAALLLPGIASAQAFIRYYPPSGVAELTSSGTTITSTLPLLLPNGTNAAPSLSFASDTDLGLYKVGDGALGVSAIGGNLVAQFGPTYGYAGYSAVLVSSSYLGWSSNTTIGTAPDVALYREAANTLALRNTTNAQAFNVYNTYTDASNYERVRLGWNANVFEIITEAAGTGSTRAILVSGGVVSLGGLTQPNTSDNIDLGETNRVWRKFNIARAIQGSKNKVLTDAAAAASFVRIAVPTNGFMGGKVIWTAQSTDGTDQRVTSGEQMFSGADKAGTVSCQVGTAWGTSTVSTNANTLVCTVTTVTSTTNCDLQVTCTDNTVGSQTMSLNYRLDMPIANTLTPQ